MKSQVLNYFKKHPFEAFNQKQMSARLGISDKFGRAEVGKIMAALAKEKQLEEQKRGKYKLSAKILDGLKTNKFVEGIVDMKSTGKAYIIPKNKEIDDIFIAANNTKHSLDGDLVKVLLFPQRKDQKPEGKVVEVLQRNKTKYVGTLKIYKHYAIVVTDSKNMPVDIFIPGDYSDKKANGKKVLVEITDWEEHLNNPSGKILSILGNAGDNEVEMQSVLVEYDFSPTFPEYVEKAAKNISVKIS
jgi:ribonuclease R